MFSKACKYAIRSVIFIAVCSLKKEKVGFKEIAKEIDAPEAFTAKILQMLAREGIIDSTKGVGGGFNIPLHRLDTTKLDRKSTRLNSSHVRISYAVFCLKKKKKKKKTNIE